MYIYSCYLSTDKCNTRLIDICDIHRSESFVHSFDVFVICKFLGCLIKFQTFYDVKQVAFQPWHNDNINEWKQFLSYYL